AGETLAALGAFVEAAVAGGASPVVLAAPLTAALEIAPALAARGHLLRGHRSIVAAAALGAAAGLRGVPVARADGDARAAARPSGPASVLLWPPGEDARAAAAIARLP